MKLQTSIAIILISTCFFCFFSGCNTTTSKPNIQNLQPSQQDQDRAKVANAIIG